MAITLLPTAVVRAAEYSFEYGVDATYEYNENVNLQPDPISVSGGFIALPVTLARRSERLETSLAAEASFHRFDVEEYDSDNQDLRGDLSYALENGELTSYLGYTRDTTRNSEFLDTGIVGPLAIRREAASAGAGISELLTERNGFVAGLDYRDTRYDSTLFQDFDFLSGYGGWLHQWSERTQLRLQAYGNRFENRDGIVNVSSEGLGAQAGIERALSEQLTMSVLLGWISVATDYSEPTVEDPEDDGSYLVDAELAYQSERARWRFGLTSEPTPSGVGVLLDSTRANLSYRYRLTERANLDLSAILGTQSAQDPRINQDRDFASGNLRLDYRLAEAWYIAGRYEYRWQDAEAQTDTADGSTVLLSLRWQPEKSVWSR